MPFSEVMLDHNLHETVMRGTPMFPCSRYVEDTIEYPGNEFPWHWHEELELAVVTEGAMMVGCGESSFVAEAGQGYFINSNVLHTFRARDGKNCRYETLVFHHSLLSGAPESVFEQKYMRPILHSSKIETFCLTPEIEWQKEAIAHIRRALDAAHEGAFGYELQVRENLSHVWYLLVLHSKSIISSGKSISSIDAERLKRMIAFIHNHYAEPITVMQIAAAADVSQSECYRCFKRIVGQPPIVRLNNYRIHRAAGLLADTNMSVTEVCYAVGFNSPSYFSKLFVERMRCTPRAYRQRDQKQAKNKKSAG